MIVILGLLGGVSNVSPRTAAAWSALHVHSLLEYYGLMAGVLVLDPMTWSKRLKKSIAHSSEEISRFLLSVLSVADSDQGRLLIG